MNLMTLLSNPEHSNITNSNLAALAEIAARVVGRFQLNGADDQWAVDRTRQWCQLFAEHPWRCRLNVAAGVMVFEFADQRDASRFRLATAGSPTLITCA